MKWADFLHADTNLGKLKVTLIIIGFTLSKLGKNLKNHGTLKSGVFHKWYDELSILIKWFFHVDSDEIIFGLAANLLCSFDI